VSRRQPKNPSGKYVRMTDEQLAADNAAFQRAVERQGRIDRAKAEAARAKRGAAMSKHTHEPTIPTRPKSATNICRCGAVVYLDSIERRWLKVAR
jgi:hypothetical protein